MTQTPEANSQDLMGNRVFRRLFLAHTASLLGSALTMAALPLLAEELMGKGKGAWAFGIALAIRIAVFVFVAPLAGTISARVGRRPLLIATDIFRAAVVAGFFFASELWHIYLLAFLLNLGSALFTPVYKSVIPGVVGDRLYPRALALGSMAYKISDVIGPMLAAAVILAFDFRGNFLLDIATFAGSALLLMSLSFPGATTRGAETQKRADVFFGMRQMLARPGLRRSLALSLCESVVGSLVIISTASYVIGELNLPESMYPRCRRGRGNRRAFCFGGIREIRPAGSGSPVPGENFDRQPGDCPVGGGFDRTLRRVVCRMGVRRNRHYRAGDSLERRTRLAQRRTRALPHLRGAFFAQSRGMGHLLSLGRVSEHPDRFRQRGLDFSGAPWSCEPDPTKETAKSGGVVVRARVYQLTGGTGWRRVRFADEIVATPFSDSLAVICVRRLASVSRRCWRWRGIGRDRSRQMEPHREYRVAQRLAATGERESNRGRRPGLFNGFRRQQGTGPEPLLF